MGPITWEAKREALSVPFEGPVPTAALFELTPTHYYCDFTRARLSHAPEVQRGLGTGLLNAFKAAQRPPDEHSVRVAFHLNWPMRPRVLLEAWRHRFLIEPGGGGPYPFKAGAAPTPAPRAASIPPFVEPLATPRPRPVQPTPAPPRRAVPPTTTAITAVNYDAGRHLFVVNFTGDLPAFAVRAMGATRRAVVFRNSVLQLASGNQAMSSDPLIAGWSLAGVTPSGHPHLTLQLRRPGTLYVANDAARKRLLVIPQPDPPPEPAGEAGVQTVFGRVLFDAANGSLAIPYYGHSPIYRQASLDATCHTIDFAHAASHPAGLQLDTPTEFPPMSFWMLAESAGTSMVRMAISMPYGGHVRLKDDIENRRLLVFPLIGPEQPGEEVESPEAGTIVSP